MGIFLGYTAMFLFSAVIIRVANPLRICSQMMPLCTPISFMFVKIIQNSLSLSLVNKNL